MNHVSSFSEFLITQLNREQQQAVTHQNGVLLVCAGAGSGKTRVITSRIAHLILNQNVPASSIIALTFTNKAAREMKERVASFLPQETSLPFVGTFHSYCLQILKQNNDFIRIPNFSIMDDDDQEKLVKNNNCSSWITKTNYHKNCSCTHFTSEKRMHNRKIRLTHSARSSYTNNYTNVRARKNCR